MQINFKAAGLDFMAEVNYSPLIPAKTNAAPENCYEDEGGEIEIIMLQVGSNDATFLLEYKLLEEIETAACEAAEKFKPDLT